MLSARSASQDFITSICHFICLSVRDEMKNSTAVEVASIPSSENYLDRDFLNDIQKRSNLIALLLAKPAEKQLLALAWLNIRLVVINFKKLIWVFDYV